jgi:vacuolar protein sorting-associated protein 16
MFFCLDLVLNRDTASSVSIFKPGSTSPAATLYDAWENFSRRSPKADESIRSIRPDLATAVNECIDAAGREWEPHWQRRLLNVNCVMFILFFRAEWINLL